jgi:L-iditol 2-dehydrogenase
MSTQYIYNPDLQGFSKVKSGEHSALKKGEVLISAQVIGICGSDINRLVHNVAKPAIGHEWVGKVLRSESEDFKSGDWVTSVAHVACLNCKECENENFRECNQRQLLGGEGVATILAQETVLRQEDLIPLPTPKDESEMKKMSLLEVAFIGDCAYFQAKRIGLEEKNNILVFGAGPVGLFTALAFKERGFDVTIIEPKKERLELAREINVDAVAFSKALIEGNHFNKYDVVIDCSGDSYGAGAVSVLGKFVKVFGKVVIVGRYKKANIVEMDFFEKSVAAAWVSNHQHSEFLKSIDFWFSRLDKIPDSWQTSFPIEQINDAFDEAKTRNHLKCCLCLNKEKGGFGE